MKKDDILIGLAMFSMFFGAGNVIFPLAVGQFAGDKNIYAIFKTQDFYASKNY